MYEGVGEARGGEVGGEGGYKCSPACSTQGKKCLYVVGACRDWGVGGGTNVRRRVTSEGSVFIMCLALIVGID